MAMPRRRPDHRLAEIGDRAGRTAGTRPAIRRSSVDLPDPVRPSSPTISPSRELQLDAVEHQKLAAVGARKGLAQRMNVEKRGAAWPMVPFRLRFSPRRNLRSA